VPQRTIENAGKKSKAPTNLEKHSFLCEAQAVSFYAAAKRRVFILWAQSNIITGGISGRQRSKGYVLKGSLPCLLLYKPLQPYGMPDKLGQDPDAENRFDADDYAAQTLGSWKQPQDYAPITSPDQPPVPTAPASQMSVLFQSSQHHSSEQHDSQLSPALPYRLPAMHKLQQFISNSATVNSCPSTSLPHESTPSWHATGNSVSALIAPIPVLLHKDVPLAKPSSSNAQLVTDPSSPMSSTRSLSVPVRRHGVRLTRNTSSSTSDKEDPSNHITTIEFGSSDGDETGSVDQEFMGVPDKADVDGDAVMASDVDGETYSDQYPETHSTGASSGAIGMDANTGSTHGSSPRHLSQLPNPELDGPEEATKAELEYPEELKVAGFCINNKLRLALCIDCGRGFIADDMLGHVMHVHKTDTEALIAMRRLDRNRNGIISRYNLVTTYPSIPNDVYVPFKGLVIHRDGRVCSRCGQNLPSKKSHQTHWRTVHGERFRQTGAESSNAVTLQRFSPAGVPGRWTFWRCLPPVDEDASNDVMQLFHATRAAASTISRANLIINDATRQGQFYQKTGWRDVLGEHSSKELVELVALPEEDTWEMLLKPSIMQYLQTSLSLHMQVATLQTLNTSEPAKKGYVPQLFYVFG
jgi:hypothetical protein